MGSLSRPVFLPCLLVVLLTWIGRPASSQDIPASKPQKSRETADVTLSFRYLEGPGLSLANKTGSPKHFRIFSEKELKDWLAQASDNPDVWKMNDPVVKFYSFGPRTGGGFLVETNKGYLCNYQIALKDKGDKINLDLMANIWMGEPKSEFSQSANSNLADGETVILQSPRPEKNINRLLLVSLKRRPLSPQRTVRLELRFIEGEPKSSPRQQWSCFNSKYQFGVPEKEVEEWFAKLGTTLETQTAKLTYQDIKNTDNWSIVDNVYKAPTDFLPEVISALTEFFCLKIIKSIECTESDLFTTHGTKIQLVPDPSNETSPMPFLLKTEISQTRGSGSEWSMETRTTPKPGHYLCIDTTKPTDTKWKILLVRAISENE